MGNPANSSNGPMIETLRRKIADSGITLGTVSVGAPNDLDAAFVEIARQQPEALFVLTDNSLAGLAEPIIARALQQRVPTFGNFSGTFAREGALFTYARDPKEAYRSVARLVQNILAGVAPADLPIEQPTKFTLTINLKTAKSLGLAIPPPLLARADEVIE
jgi:putative ABC transport system substrate-binding protein